MNEQLARNVILLRSIETADQKHEILSQDDRTHASRSARELAQWQATENKSEITSEHFLQQRAELLLRRVAERTPAFAAFLKQGIGLRLLWRVLPILALLAGAALDRIADPHRVDLLSAPLLLIIGWNLAVYLLLLLWIFVPSPGWLMRDGMNQILTAGKRALPRKLPHALSAAVFSFWSEWSRLSAGLTRARMSRTVHLSAALFAVGAVLSLYARGFLSQYVAGWESTFLNAAQVHYLLSKLFAPAMLLFPLQGFSIAEIESLRFGQPTLAASGARWVHLYAVTLLLLVILPRLLLAGFAHWQAQKLERDFPIDLQQPYFRQFGEAMGAAPGILRVLPYSFTVDEARDRGLNAIAAMLLGEQARVMLRPSSAYGDEPKDAMRDIGLNDPEVAMTAVLFNLGATPEKENHGAFLDYLVRNTRRGIAVLIDASAYQERVGTQAGGKARVAERIALWQQFCSFHHAPATIVNLIDPTTYPLDAGAGLKLSVAP